MREHVPDPPEDEELCHFPVATIIREDKSEIPVYCGLPKMHPDQDHFGSVYLEE